MSEGREEPTKERRSDAGREIRPEDRRTPDPLATHADADDPGLVREFVDFLRHNRKWWLAPIIVTLLLIGMVVALAGSAAAPFIYTLF